jgi:hypothetical protein
MKATKGEQQKQLRKATTGKQQKESNKRKATKGKQQKEYNKKKPRKGEQQNEINKRKATKGKQQKERNKRNTTKRNQRNEIDKTKSTKRNHQKESSKREATKGKQQKERNKRNATKGAQDTSTKPAILVRLTTCSASASFCTLRRSISILYPLGAPNTSSSSSSCVQTPGLEPVLQAAAKAELKPRDMLKWAVRGTYPNCDSTWKTVDRSVAS